MLFAVPLKETRAMSQSTCFRAFALAALASAAMTAVLSPPLASDDEKLEAGGVLAKPGLFEPLTEPPCSYCSTQNRKGFIRGDDRVIAWIRGAHNGGAIPIRLFLAAPRVINDTYGIFFYDPDGGYVAAYKKDYGYSFYGWRRGVMVVKGPDFEGPKKGQRLERVPNAVTTWEHWLMLHPESTAYDLFDGKKYKSAPLPEAMSAEAKRSMGEVDARLKPLVEVIGVQSGEKTIAFPLDGLGERASFQDEVGGEPVAAFWYGPTKSAVAFSRKLDGQVLDFYADEISPETAPFKDKQTGTRWTLAGRGVDGPLKGKELQWADGIQCRWYAWAAEHPGTRIHAEKK
jgi:hypothetical protein